MPSNALLWRGAQLMNCVLLPMAWGRQCCAPIPLASQTVRMRFWRKWKPRSNKTARSGGVKWLVFALLWQACPLFVWAINDDDTPAHTSNASSVPSTQARTVCLAPDAAAAVAAMVEDALRVLAGRVATTARESRTGLLGRLTAGLGQQHRRAFKASSSSSSACTWEKKHTLTLLQEYDPGGGGCCHCE